MSDNRKISKRRDDYLIEGALDDTGFRLIVPKELVDDEVGDQAQESERLDWIRSNLPQILQAYTARIEGGWVKSPWDRVLVEEIN